MKYYIPETPEGVTTLRVLNEGPVNSMAERFLARAVPLRSLVGPMQFAMPAITGVFDPMGHASAKNRVHPEREVRIPVKGARDVLALQFLDMSVVLAVDLDHEDPLLTYCPAPLYCDFTILSCSKEDARGVAKDAEIWLEALKSLPRLRLSIHGKDDHSLWPTWIERNLMTPPESEKLSAWLELAIRAFCAQHGLASYDNGPCIEVKSRNCDRRGQLTAPEVQVFTSQKQRAEFENEIDAFTQQIEDLLSSPASPIPVAKQVCLRTPGTESRRRAALMPIYLATAKLREDFASRHEAMQAIAAWNQKIAAATDNAEIGSQT